MVEWTKQTFILLGVGILCLVFLLMIGLNLGGIGKVCTESAVMDPLVYALLIIVTGLGYWLYKAKNPSLEPVQQAPAA